MLELSEYEEEAILLQAAVKGFPKEVTLELCLTMEGSGRNSKQKELTKKYTTFLKKFILYGYKSVYESQTVCDVKVAQSCLTLCDPLDYTVHGILQDRILK